MKVLSALVIFVVIVAINCEIAPTNTIGPTAPLPSPTGATATPNNQCANIPNTFYSAASNICFHAICSKGQTQCPDQSSAQITMEPGCFCDDKSAYLDGKCVKQNSTECGPNAYFWTEPGKNSTRVLLDGSTESVSVDQQGNIVGRSNMS